MENETHYFINPDGGSFGSLWKKEGLSNEFYFSEKTFSWIPAERVMIMPAWPEMTKEAANDLIQMMKDEGANEEETTPIRYFLSNSDHIYAMDIKGNEFYVRKGRVLEPAKHGTIDCMWGGIDESQIDGFLI